MGSPRARICVLAALLVALASILGGCGGAEPAAGDGSHEVEVVEKDFHISVPPVLQAGGTDLAVLNRGPVSHELIVVRGTDRALPMRQDGVTVDEDAVENRTVGVLEPQAAGVRDLSLSLDPGRYVLFCNMTGHYMGGMHTEFVVR